MEKRRSENPRPACPKCGQDMKRSLENYEKEPTQAGKKSKWGIRAYGWHCLKCHVEIYD